MKGERYVHAVDRHPLLESGLHEDDLLHVLDVCLHFCAEGRQQAVDLRDRLVLRELRRRELVGRLPVVRRHRIQICVSYFCQCYIVRVDTRLPATEELFQSLVVSAPRYRRDGLLFRLPVDVLHLEGLFIPREALHAAVAPAVYQVSGEVLLHLLARIFEKFVHNAMAFPEPGLR